MDERRQINQIMDALVRSDFVFLTDLVRGGTKMEPRARALLADILLNIVTGKWKKVAHKPRSRATEKRRNNIGTRIAKLESEGWPPEAAVTKAAEEFDLSPRWVWQMRAEYGLIQDLAKKLRVSSKVLAKQAPDRLMAILDKQRLSLAKAFYEEYKPERN
jgi:hypothetical protein